MSRVDEEVRWFFFPNEKKLCTRSLYLFLQDYYKVIDLFYFTMSLARKADEVAVGASKVLIELEEDENKKKEYKDTLDNPDRVSKKLKEFSSLHSKNLTVNIVDSFLWFLSSAIQASMKKKPELVKSGESIKIEEIFEFSSKKDLINYLIDKKINSLSYGGIDGLERFVDEALGINLFSDEESRTLMKVFIEARNILVHNRGIVNKIFLKRIKHHPDFKIEEGRRFHLGFDDLVRLSKVCVETALTMDDQVTSKFKIERKQYRTWRARSLAAQK